MAPTEDVQLTDEIRALATALGNHPVQIVHWVYDHIEFLPTYGSVQGSHLTWLTKRGNACDTASLLVALLRAANIPARYVYGTVQMPIDQVINWVGAAIPESALQLLGQGGMPHTAVVQGGVITAVKLEHVWVEAWVDFFPSQGARHVQGDTWIPLDASFKPYRALPGMALPTALPFDVSAFLTQATAGATIHPSEGWVQGLNQANINTLLTAYQEQVVSFVTTQKAQATVDDVLGTRQSIPAGRPVLTAGLQPLYYINSDDLEVEAFFRGRLWEEFIGETSAESDVLLTPRFTGAGATDARRSHQAPLPGVRCTRWFGARLAPDLRRGPPRHRRATPTRRSHPSARATGATRRPHAP